MPRAAATAAASSAGDSARPGSASASALDRPPSASSAAAAAAGPPAPAAPLPGSFVCSVRIEQARNLFSVDERDDPDAARNAKKKGGAAGAASATAGAAAAGKAPSTPDGAPRTPQSKAAPPATGAANKKGGKKGGADDDEACIPLHTFVTFTPFEPVMLPPAAVVVPQTAAEKKKAAAAAAKAGETLDEGPPPPVFLHSIQTPLSSVAAAAAGGVDDANGTNPQWRFEHVQRLQSPEAFKDAIWSAPFTLHLYQFIPNIDGKKKKPAAAAGGAAGAPGGGGSGGAALASRKKKLGRKGEDDDPDARPFGELDPEQVVKLGEVRVDLATPLLHQSAAQVRGWFPLQVAEETMTTARNLATQRGKPLLFASNDPASRPELYLDLSLDTILVGPEEAAKDNRLSITIDRIERVPHWILDVAHMEALELVKRLAADKEAAIIAAANASAEPASPQASAPAGADAGFALQLGALGGSPTHAAGNPSSRAEASPSASASHHVRKSSASTKTSRGGSRAAAAAAAADDHPDPLADFPEKDYTDSFALKYNLVLSGDAAGAGGVVKTIAPPPPAPAIGWSESQREQKYGEGRMAFEWVMPMRELPRLDDTPLSPKEAKKKAAAEAAAASSASAGERTGRKPSSSGRSTPGQDGPAAAGSESHEIQYAPVTEFNPSLSRGALLFGHSRSAYLSSGSTASFRAGIQQDQRFLMALEHVRTPHDEKLVEAGRTITQRALALVDLRPLLKPGVTELTGAFVLRQTSAPLPASPPEESKGKKGATARSATTPLTGKRTLVDTHTSVGPDGAPVVPAAPTPPETFDEAHSFVVVTFRLDRPLVPRRAPLHVRDVLPDAQGIVRVQSAIAQSFLSVAAASRVEQPQQLLAQPMRISSAEEQPLATATTFAAPSPDAAASLQAFRAEVRALVSQFLAAYADSGLSAEASPQQQTNACAPVLPVSSVEEHTSSLPSLSPVLASSGLAAAALEKLSPALSALVSSRFFAAVPTDSLAGPRGDQETRDQHRKNELYVELVREVTAVVREHTAAGQQSQHDSEDARRKAARASFDKASELASHAECAGVLALAAQHHSTRLSQLTLRENAAAALGLTERDVSAAWFEYGSFLLRRQNGPEDIFLAPDTPADAPQPQFGVPFGPKTGSIDGGANAAIDLAEECFHQCLAGGGDEGGAHAVPALINLACIQLEQGEVEAALPFLSRAVECTPRHALLLAIQGLYHELAEEDELALAAFDEAGDALNEFLALQRGADEPDDDALLHTLLGAHGQGAASLPLGHSQSVGLMLARFLSSQGFRNLARRVLEKEVAAVDVILAAQDASVFAAEDTPAAAAAAAAAASANDNRFDVHQFGPYLELALLHAPNPALYASHTSPLLRKAQAILERKAPTLHHAHSLLWGFSRLGEGYWSTGETKLAMQCYEMYLAFMREQKMNIFLDPVVLFRTSSLYLLKHQLSSAQSLATLLCTHPSASRSPFYWILLARTLTAGGRHAAAEEAIGEALARDDLSGLAWAVRCQGQLARLQADQHARKREAGVGGAYPYALDMSAFAECFHAFERACILGHEDRELWIELGRLWAHNGWNDQAQSALRRAKTLASDPSLDQKLQWLALDKAGLAPAEETRAAVTIQNQFRAANARKHTNKKKKIITHNVSNVVGIAREEAKQDA